MLAAKTLGVALTSRNKGAADEIPMAGVPFHAVESYLRKMIAAGHKVAICEQMEDASQAKGLVKREVVRLMTPGTLTDDPLLDGRVDNFLAGVAFNITKSDGYRAAVAWVELSTGAMVAASGSEQQILDQIACLRPAEVLIPEHASGQPHEIGRRISAMGIRAITPRPGWQFTPHHSREQLQKQWNVATAGGFGFADDDPAVLATAALLSYLQETQKCGLAHIRPLRRHIVDAHLNIDPASWRSLEIDRTVRTGGTEGTLLAAIDRTGTAMGAPAAAAVAAISAVRQRTHRGSPVGDCGAAGITGGAGGDHRESQIGLRCRADHRPIVGGPGRAARSGGAGPLFGFDAGVARSAGSIAARRRCRSRVGGAAGFLRRAGPISSRRRCSPIPLRICAKAA